MTKTRHTYNRLSDRKYHIVFYIAFNLTLVLLLQGSLKAQNIGNWTFNNTLTGTPGSFNTISTADFSAGVPTHSYNGGTEYFGENGWPSGALNTAMYMQFSLTPSAGYQLDISSLVLTIRRSNTGSPAGAGPNSWALRSSLDGFTTTIASGSMTYNYANYTVTPGSSFLNLYGTVTFRLYGYNTTVNPGGNNRLVIDNITVKGLGYLLPVKLGAFTAAITDSRVNISYTVYNTEKNSLYLIERSPDGINFSTVHTTEETDNTAEKKYACTDDLPLLNSVSQLFYRVRLISQSAAPAYSASIVVKRNISALPVKTFIRNNQLYISGTLPNDGVYQADVYTTAGQALRHIVFTATAGYNTCTLPLNMPAPASYIIHLSGNKGYSSAVLSVNQ